MIDIKTAVMQPYLFPYIGYFQLIYSTDIFVIFDNVQFIKRGWINRNRILLNEQSFMITVPVIKDQRHVPINQRYFVNDHSSRDKILKTIHHAYHNAPHFKCCSQLLETIIHHENNNVSDYTYNSVKIICTYLDINTPLLTGSKLDISKQKDYQDTIIGICKHLHTDQFINPIGGLELYSAARFKENGILLQFLKTNETLYYKQFNNSFIPNLSIIDVMMFNSKREIAELLKKYDLVRGKN